jgi:hypothetical protein
MLMLKVVSSNAGEDAVKQEHCWWECKLVQPIWKAL